MWAIDKNDIFYIFIPLSLIIFAFIQHNYPALNHIFFSYADKLVKRYDTDTCDSNFALPKCLVPILIGNIHQNVV